MPARFKAFLLHIAGSLAIGLLILLLVFQFWYPSPLHEAVGVTHIFLLLLLVDVMLGPLLTLVIYRKGKKTLVFDLAVIVLLQFCALGYGLWTVAQGRPAWLVFNVDRFDLVRVLDIDERKLADAREEYRRPSWFGPRWVAATSPADIAARNQLLFEAILGGSDLPQRPDLYHPLSTQTEAIKAKLRPLAELERFNSQERTKTERQHWPAADAWLPLMANARPMVVFMRKETAEVMAIVDLRPWQE